MNWLQRRRERKLQSKVVQRTWWFAKNHNIDHRSLKSHLLNTFRNGRYKSLQKIAQIGLFEDYYEHVCSALDSEIAPTRKLQH